MLRETSSWTQVSQIKQNGQQMFTLMLLKGDGSVFTMIQIM